MSRSSIVDPDNNHYISVDDIQLVCLSSLMSLAHICEHSADLISSSDFKDFSFDDFYYLFYKKVKFLDRDLRRYFNHSDCGR